MQPTTKRLEANGITLAYNVYENAGAPVLVMVHGLTSTKESYNLTIPYLEETYHILSLDLRGHGESTQQGPYVFDQLIEDIRAVFDHEGIEKATLVGGSFSNAPIQQFAVRYPERVENVVMLDGGFARNVEMPGYDIEAIKARPEFSWASKEEVIEMARSGYAEHVNDFVDEQTMREFEQRADGRWYFRLPREAFMGYAQEYATFSLDELAEKMSLPVLVLKATRQPEFYEEALGRYLAKFPTAQAVKIPDSPHPLMVSHPQEVAGYIDRFVRGESL
ncbi:alpha/beta hydrolase [Tumebacillus sp. ITR2]|uniref:Alpha/beta hydrolase n=1 Tax=Tumebacillus amylolyticus TaxID=2801339 RepID=A0ABS1J8K9_9BACL|nr:alpha/beta hydrolase [Tumebacillus amylolyticus]MBL0386535.1 alpha/beta hydrolase [Tumebacillus amylolyticus]